MNRLQLLPFFRRNLRSLLQNSKQRQKRQQEKNGLYRRLTTAWSGRRRLLMLAIAVLCFVLTAFPVQAAERIYLSYGLLGFSISVQDLETFAQGGKTAAAIHPYLGLLSAKQQAQFRDVLRARYEVDPVTVAQFSYTSSGDRLLKEIGRLIETPARQNGFHSIRAASILAAADPKGLSILNWLRLFPTDIRFDVSRILKLVQKFSALIKTTAQSMTALEQQSAAIATAEPAIDFKQRPDLRDLGDFPVSMQTLRLHDSKRDRLLITDLYLPASHSPASTQPSSIPVIVVSNGLGARRDRFQELAQHLASHGFAVAIPDHPGSDRQRLQDFHAGLYQENFDANEFVNRPLDIIYLLDQLAQLNSQELQGQLNLQQVGVFGYSFGGTTALSLTGATLNFEQLEQDCGAQTTITNISLLYQCRALELPRQLPRLEDDRIKAVYGFVPFGKSLFGAAGMSQVKVPILWEATDVDILTPLVIEQLPAFNALTTPDKYLVVSKGLPHARLTLDILNRLTNRSLRWEKLRPIAQNYHNALSLALFKVYVAQDESYRPYLQATYTQALTEKPYALSLVRSGS